MVCKDPLTISPPKPLQPGLLERAPRHIWDVSLSLPGCMYVKYIHAYAHARRDVGRHRELQPFNEKREYSPNVSIEYVDDAGRLLSSKEVRVSYMLHACMPIWLMITAGHRTKSGHNFWSNVHNLRCISIIFMTRYIPKDACQHY